MNLVYATCSGTNEFTDIKNLVCLMKLYPLGEIGVQVSEKQSPKGGARLEWIHELAAYLKHHHDTINAALHVNRTWVEEMCRGVVVEELEDLLELRDCCGAPFFKRIQLNFKLGRDDVREDCDDAIVMLQRRLGRRFILSFNESNARLVRRLWLKGLLFDCLYDSSFGKGIAPDSREKPVFTNVLQGYAGGITPDNVVTELKKIAKAVDNSPACGRVYIDAQKGLEDNNGHLSLNKCEDYLIKARFWETDNCSVFDDLL